ncbi:hypothetical protein GGI43DRAFT_400280 [Trichoderma evansii]
MLSERHHILYWIISLTSLLTQPLRLAIKEHFCIDDAAQIIFEYATSSYGIW